MNTEQMGSIATERSVLHQTVDAIQDYEALRVLNDFAQAVYVKGYSNRKLMRRTAVRCLQALRLSKDEATDVYLVLLRLGV